jgi:tetratricopeptide (TPR) repeat protein
VAPQPVPCGTKTADPGKQGATEQFPFPGEASGGGASLTPYAEPAKLSGVPQAPDAAGAAASAGSGAGSAAKTAAQFPFPGEDGKDGASGTPDASAGADGSSSSSSSSSDDDAAAANPDAKTTDADAKTAGTPDAAGLTDKGSVSAPGRHLLHRVNPVGTKLQTADEREAEDLSVARFYTETGDLQGAYLRSQDAVKTEPDDPDAHFALAEAALKLNKRDEAIAEYKACLKLDPVDKEAKEARKALERLKP